MFLEFQFIQKNFFQKVKKLKISMENERKIVGNPMRFMGDNFPFFHWLNERKCIRIEIEKFKVDPVKHDLFAKFDAVIWKDNNVLLRHRWEIM